MQADTMSTLRASVRRIVFCILALSCSFNMAAQDRHIPLKVPRVSRPPALEDFLQNRPREAEVVVTDFKQMDPVDGAPISQQTTAYLSHDDKYLYIGWICKDDPKKVRSRLARRKDIGNDDRVTINIDTFHDRSRSYWFDVNPYAVQMDGRSTDGQNDDTSWEGQWNTEGRFTNDGYVILQAIPFRTLRFPRGPKQLWGVMLGRMIQRNNEFAMWPWINHNNGNQFIGQFADLEIDEDISPGRNMQFIPYGLLAGDRYLSGSRGMQNSYLHHVGLDAKMVLHDSFTLDATINPDFSQIETDDPVSNVNSRYATYYTEKRPFFLENSQLFNLPETIFYSRMIVDPQFGARLTGAVGKWNTGLVIADDRAPGEGAAIGGERGKRATDVIARIDRHLMRQSHIGLMATSYSFAGLNNEVFAADARIELPGNWLISAMSAVSRTEDHGSVKLAPEGIFKLITNGSHFSYSATYHDISPNFDARLGYIERTDMRYFKNFAQYLWRVKNSFITNYGPNGLAFVDYNRAGKLQFAQYAGYFGVNMRSQTYMSFGGQGGYELYRGVGYHPRQAEVYFSNEPTRWVSYSGDYIRARWINYHPSAARSPELGDADYINAGLTVHPVQQWKIEQSYILNRLHADNKFLARTNNGSSYFTNHILRTKMNYQFTRAMAARVILDYNAVLANQKLFGDDTTKTVGASLLLSYMPHPGTAIYAGYSNTWDNLGYATAAPAAQWRTNYPSLMTDRQLFLKVSYLFSL